jgi:hypothetical protein
MKKTIQAIMFLFVILALLSPAQSDVTGVWYTNGKLKISAKTKGYKATKYNDFTTDTIEFNSNNTLRMETAGIDGTWVQTGKKWVITSVNTSEVETFFHNYMWDNHGVNVTVTFGSFISSGKEGKKGTSIKGKVVIKGSYLDHVYGPGVATATYTFTGYRDSSAAQDLQSPDTKDLKTAIAESLAEVILDMRK